MREGKQITIVIAIITNNNGEILLARRHEPEANHSHGKWEFLGGGININETPEEAVIREAREEGGVDIKIKRLLPKIFTNLWEFGDGRQQQVIMLSYEGKIIAGAPAPNLAENVSELKFFPIEAIKNLDTLPKVYEMAKLALADS
jgi:8-oxo-dGTP diphosphatase